MHKTAAALVAAVALLAACGGDDSAADPTDAPTPDTVVTDTAVTDTAVTDTAATDTVVVPTEAPADTSAPLDDQAIVEASLLTRADFPAGWLTEPEDDDDPAEVAAAQADFRACFGVETDEFVDLGSARADSDVMTSPDGGGLVSSVSLGSDDTVAEAFMARIQADGVTECATEAGRALMEITVALTPQLEGAEIGDVSVELVELRPIGDEAVGYAVSVPLTLRGDSATVHTDVVVARVGRGVTEVSTQGSTRQIPLNQLEHYLEIAAGRLAENLS